MCRYESVRLDPLKVAVNLELIYDFSTPGISLSLMLTTLVILYKLLHTPLDSDWLKLTTQSLPYKELNLLQMSEYCAISEKSQIFSRTGQNP